MNETQKHKKISELYDDLHDEIMVDYKTFEDNQMHFSTYIRKVDKTRSKFILEFYRLMTEIFHDDTNN
jgi:hypothetical protein